MLLVVHRTPSTAAQCDRLAAAGASVFELDVQVAHERLVVSHFLPVLRRPGWLENDNWRFRWSAGLDQDPAVSDAVARIPQSCSVLLDLKETAPHRRAELNRRIAHELTDRDRFVVSSAETDDLDDLRAAGFRTWRTIGDRRSLRAVLAGGPLADAAVTVRHRLLDRSTMERLHAVAPAVVAWTVNSVGRAHELRAQGVDGITTDSSSVLVRARP